MIPQAVQVCFRICSTSRSWCLLRGGSARTSKKGNLVEPVHSCIPLDHAPNCSPGVPFSEGSGRGSELQGARCLPHSHTAAVPRVQRQLKIRVTKSSGNSSRRQAALLWRPIRRCERAAAQGSAPYAQGRRAGHPEGWRYPDEHGSLSQPHRVRRQNTSIADRRGVRRERAARCLGSTRFSASQCCFSGSAIGGWTVPARSLEHGASPPPCNASSRPSPCGSPAARAGRARRWPQ